MAPLGGAVGIVMTGSATMAEAKTKFFIVDGTDFAGGVQGEMSAYGPVLVDGSDTSFQFGFTLPKDYKRNSPVKIVLKGQADGSSCAVRIDVNLVARMRTGTGQSNNFGATGVMAGQTITIPAGDMPVVAKTFTLFKATIGPLLDQKAGDKIVIDMSRVPSHVDDTCADTFTPLSAKIIYTVK